MKETKSKFIEELPALEFMGHVVGLEVLHPGGFGTTRKLVESCGINKNSNILDIGSGKGTSSFYIAQKYGCRVTGIDTSKKG